jgi:CRP/FNR family cyclic AMP-dependent transcriptional regulator
MQVSPEKTVKAFFSKYPLIHYAKNEHIAIDTPPRHIFLVESGYVQQYITTVDSQRISFTIFKPGAFFPMMAVMAKSQNPFSYYTLTPVSLRRCPAQDALQMLKDNPEVMESLLTRVFSGIDGLLQQISNNILGSSRNKIVSTLIMLTNRFGNKTPRGQLEISLPLTQQQIASLAGTSRETASRELNQLIKNKSIRRRKKIYIVPNLAALKEELSGS